MRWRDWDNLAKSVCDALEGIAFVNDKQISDARVLRRHVRGQKSHEIRV